MSVRGAAGDAACGVPRDGLVIASEDVPEARENCDHYITYDNQTRYNNAFLALEYITAGQLLGLYKSLAVNNTPDNPCSTGQVSRVVKGVIIYPYHKDEVL